jgi:hypothetical protein
MTAAALMSSQEVKLTASRAHLNHRCWVWLTVLPIEDDIGCMLGAFRCFRGETNPRSLASADVRPIGAKERRPGRDHS